MAVTQQPKSASLTSSRPMRCWLLELEERAHLPLAMTGSSMTGELSSPVLPRWEAMSLQGLVASSSAAHSPIQCIICLGQLSTAVLSPCADVRGHSPAPATMPLCQERSLAPCLLCLDTTAGPACPLRHASNLTSARLTADHGSASCRFWNFNRERKWAKKGGATGAPPNATSKAAEPGQLDHQLAGLRRKAAFRRSKQGERAILWLWTCDRISAFLGAAWNSKAAAYEALQRSLAVLVSAHHRCKKDTAEHGAWAPPSGRELSALLAEQGHCTCRGHVP